MPLPLWGLLLISFAGAPAGANILYVNASATGSTHDGTSWSTALTNLDPVLTERLNSGDEIWVAAGVYAESHNPNSWGGGFVYARTGIGVYGGFSGTETKRAQRNPRVNITTLQGDGLGAVVYVADDADRTAIIDGFTIRGGSGQPFDWVPAPVQGGGIYMPAGSATISNNVIIGNNSVGYTPPLESVSQSPGPGGGIFVGYGSPAIVGNTIVNNRCGTQGSGIYIAGGNALVANNIISANTNGAAVYVAGGAPSLVNNTIVGHQGQAGLNMAVAGAAVVGNIIANNGVGVAGTAAMFTHNDVFGNQTDYASTDYTGFNANIRQNPLFSVSDYRLGAGSPCVDAGDETVLPFLMPDALGQARVMGANVDMGAVETPAAPKLWPSFTVQPGPSRANEPIRPAPVVSLYNADGSLASNFVGPVTLSVYPGSGRPGAVLSGNTTVNATAGVATFAGISVSKRGDGNVLNASGTGLVSVNSLPFAVGSAAGGNLTIRVNAAAAGAVHDGATWNSAFTTLQAALDASYDGDEIWVAAGKYQGAVGQPAAALQSGVGVYGGFTGSETSRAQRDWRRNETVLDGGLQVIPVVSVPDGAPATTIVDGFTIQNGRMHGIDCEGSTNMVIRNNKITGNSTLHISTPPGSGYMYSNGGGVYILNGSPTIVNNAFVGNFANDYGGGLYSEGSPHIANNLFLRNSAGYTPALDVDAPVGATFTITNNTFVSNGTSSWMASIQVGGWKYGSTAKTITFANNLLTYGEAINVNINTVSVRNNCFWGNLKDFYGSIPNQIGLNGNVEIDPRFYSFAGDDFRLLPSSPCRDAGDSSVVLPDELDLNGNPRLAGSAVDIGAYEFIPPQPVTIHLGVPVHSPLSAGDGALYVAADDGKVYGFLAGSAEPLLAFPVDINTVVGAPVKLRSRPAVYFGKTGKAVYISTDHGDVVRIRPDGTVAWTIRPLSGSTISTPAVTSDGRVLVNLGHNSVSDGIHNFLFQLDEVTGTALYLSPYLGASTAETLRDRSPALDQNLVYLNAGGDVTGGLVVLDAANLTVRAELATGEDALPPYLSGSSLYLATRAGRLYKANSVTLSLDSAFGKFGVANVGEPISTAPFVDGAGVYVGTTMGRIYRLDTTTGARSMVYDTGTATAIGGLTVNRLAGVLAFGDAGGGAYMVSMANTVGGVRNAVDGPISGPPVYLSDKGLFCFLTEAGTIYEIPSL